jgi:hypothetical protein
VSDSWFRLSIDVYDQTNQEPVWDRYYISAVGHTTVAAQGCKRKRSKDCEVSPSAKPQKKDDPLNMPMPNTSVPGYRIIDPAELQGERESLADHNLTMIAADGL